MQSNMMDVPLLIAEIVERARHFFKEREIVSLMTVRSGRVLCPSFTGPATAKWLSAPCGWPAR